MLQTGAQILIQSLLCQGVEVVFGYPGGSVIPIYDALYEYADRIRHILTSHEQGAAHAADGYARASGKTGVVIATSGPGATNLVTGIAAAYHDSVPLVAITGNVSQDLLGRSSFQEVDIVSMTNPITKHNYLVQDAASIAPIVAEAFEIANSGRKGPVLIDLPKDIACQLTEYLPQPHFSPRPLPQATDEALAQVAELLWQSSRPLIYAGGGVTFSGAAPQLQQLAEALQIPVCLSMMGLSALPQTSPLNFGLVGMHGTATANMAVQKCDLLLAVGARFSDRVAGNRLRFAKDAQIVHIDVDKSEISKNIHASLALVGDAADCLARLSALLPPQQHREWLRLLQAHSQSHALPPRHNRDGSLNPREVITALAEVGGPELLLATDVGQHQMLVAQYYPFCQPRTFFSSCGLGAMGYGLGAANGVAIARPGQAVALVTGDGSFHMNLAELAVSVSHQLPIVVVVLNNQVLGMVHQWQKIFYAGRYSGTEPARRTDFRQLAEAFGARGWRVERRDQLYPALEEAFALGKPAVIDCRIDSDDQVFPIIPPGGSAEEIILNEAMLAAAQAAAEMR